MGIRLAKLLCLSTFFSSCSILKDVSLDEVKMPPNVPMTVPSIETKEIKISLLIKIILSLYYIWVDFGWHRIYLLIYQYYTIFHLFQVTVQKNSLFKNNFAIYVLYAYLFIFMYIYNNFSITIDITKSLCIIENNRK